MAVHILTRLSELDSSLVRDLEIDQPQTMRALYNVGVHDIPELASIKRNAVNVRDAAASTDTNVTSGDESSPSGYVACTTDDILAMKKDLYDILVDLRPNEAPNSSSVARWPRIRIADGQALKATQRDLRRFNMLKRELDRVKTVSDDAGRNQRRSSGDRVSRALQYTTTRTTTSNRSSRLEMLHDLQTSYRSKTKMRSPSLHRGLRSRTRPCYGGPRQASRTWRCRQRVFRICHCLLTYRILPPQCHGQTQTSRQNHPS